MHTLSARRTATHHPPPRRLEHHATPRTRPLFRLRPMSPLPPALIRRRVRTTNRVPGQHDRLAAHRAAPAVDHAHPPSRLATDRGQRPAAPYLNPGTAPADNVGVGRAWRWRPTEPGSAHTQARVKRRTARCPARARAATAPRACVPGRPTPTPARPARGDRFLQRWRKRSAIAGLDPRATLSCGRSSANPGQKRCRPATASGRMVGRPSQRGHRPTGGRAASAGRSPTHHSRTRWADARR